VSESNLPLISLTREYGNGIATVKYPNGSVYEYYGIEPPAYSKIRHILYKKELSQNAKASIILKKLKAGEKAGNYKVTKISEENVVDNIDKVVDKMLETDPGAALRRDAFKMSQDDDDDRVAGSEPAPIGDLVVELADRIQEFAAEYSTNYREIVAALAEELDSIYKKDMN